MYQVKGIFVVLGGITDQSMLSHERYREKELGVEHEQQCSECPSDLAAHETPKDKRLKCGKPNLILIGYGSNPFILESTGA